MLNRRLLTEWRRAIRNSRWNADAHLRAHERSVPVDQDAIVRVDTCQLAANSPIEDFYSAAKCLSSNAFLFGVFDGHGGQSCSRHVSISLFPYICASVLQKHEVKSLPVEDRLEWLFSSADAHLPNLFINSQRQQVIDYYKAFTNNKDLHTGECSLSETTSPPTYAGIEKLPRLKALHAIISDMRITFHRYLHGIDQ